MRLRHAQRPGQGLARQPGFLAQSPKHSAEPTASWRSGDGVGHELLKLHFGERHGHRQDPFQQGCLVGDQRRVVTVVVAE